MIIETLIAGDKIYFILLCRIKTLLSISCTKMPQLLMYVQCIAVSHLLSVIGAPRSLEGMFGLQLCYFQEL